MVSDSIIKSFLSIYCLLLFISCTDKNPAVKFPVIQSLTALETKSIPDVYMRYPYRIRLVDTSLYLMDLHAVEYFCHQFAYPSMRYVRSYGKRGEGPEELLDAENIRLDSEGKLWTLDANKSKLSAWDSDHTTQTDQITLDKELMRVLDFTLYNDSVFFVPDYSGKYRFNKINTCGEIINRYFSIPTDNRVDLPSLVALSQAWRAFMDYNPQNGVLAMVTQLGHVLEIYHPDSREIIAIKTGKYSEPQFNIKEGYTIPTGIMGYSDVYVGDQYIYALFWGRSFEQMKQCNEKIEGGNQVEVFDLTGHPVKKYILDRNVSGIHIDEKNNQLIALDINSDEPVVLYEL